MRRSKEAILEELAREEQRLAELERTRWEARGRVESLRSELATTSAPAPPYTPADKVKLFRSLFRGRPDLFPTRFVNKKTGQPGYAPACANKWEPGLCALKTGGRCSACANQAFLPVSDQVILDHLQGRHVVGVYPLLEDETCWFLAADFDASTWREDVAAFAATCHSAGVPCAMERSRSGNGAHAWFFFTAPVPANVARRMGCHLITETMSRRHELRMDSYDRLFPNQDTMPPAASGTSLLSRSSTSPASRGTASSSTSGSSPSLISGRSWRPCRGSDQGSWRRSRGRPLEPAE